ncbi:hypothetical protein BDV98DRAFT_99928 [Pterulicium gracile]|uniref:Uncharacterized protein n=1 Tax=Pterulicium gracile TaxID=1884261 RepID=A0A5C3QHG2_9AGAR|nr:hypothetical protein BDV98DRAFT_99928 [Pterula gracilis]
MSRAGGGRPIPLPTALPSANDMSLTNEQARQRVQVLHTDIHTRQESVGSVQRKFEAINKETRQLIDTALKNKGVATIAELMQKVVNDIQDSDQKKAVQSALAQLNPPTTFTGIIWDKIKDPVTDELVIGQFIAINKLRELRFELCFKPVCDVCASD